MADRMVVLTTQLAAYAARALGIVGESLMRRSHIGILLRPLLAV